MTENIHPIQVIKETFYIWIGFLMFTKLTPTTTLITVGLLIVTFLLSTFNKYYDNYYNKLIENNLDKKDKIVKELEMKKDNINYYKNLSKYGIILTVIIGFILYFNKQYNDHNNDFSYTKFLFGIPNCKNL